MCTKGSIDLETKAHLFVYDWLDKRKLLKVPVEHQDRYKEMYEHGYRRAIDDVADELKWFFLERLGAKE